MTTTARDARERATERATVDRRCAVPFERTNERANRSIRRERAHVCDVTRVPRPGRRNRHLRVLAVPARQFASGDADKPRDATTRDDASSPGMASAVWDAFLLIDPLLPTGGFAHLLGLEPTLLSGALADDGDVRTVGAFVEDVGQNALDAQVPFVLAARECAACEDPREDSNDGGG